MEIRVGARIRELRAKKGLSQKDLARELGVSHVTVGRWEHGTREISLTMLARVADVLGVELSEFFPKVQAPLFPPEEARRRARRAEAPSPSPEPTGAGQWGRIRELSPQAKQGIRDYLAALGRHVPLNSPEGERIKPNLILAIEELAESNPDPRGDPFEPYSVLHKLTRESAREFAREAPPEVLADVLLAEDAQSVEASDVAGFLAFVREAA
jgi:transcriptional regulator with XRE-family HTH domain